MDDEPAERLAALARERPDAVDLDALGICLDAESAAVRLRAAEAVGRLALAGRDVTQCRDRIEALLADTDLLDERIPLSVDDSREEAFQPLAVAFAVSALALTDQEDPESLLRLALRAHERRHSEFDAEVRRYSAVRDLGWALASAVILADAHYADLLDLVEHPHPAVRRVGTAGLSDVAEEYAPIRGEPPDETPRLAAAAVDRLADDADRRVRYYAAFALYEFGLDDPEAVRGHAAALRGALDDEYELVRKEAAGALGFLGVTEAIEGIRDLRDDPSDRVREAARSALEELE